MTDKRKRKPHIDVVVAWSPPATQPQTLEQAIDEAHALAARRHEFMGLPYKNEDFVVMPSSRKEFQREFSHVPHIRDGEFTDFIHPLKV